ncbi:MAG: endo alpha-1,4 polygalactosaminidase [Caldisericia bacterium]
MKYNKKFYFIIFFIFLPTLLINYYDLPFNKVSCGIGFYYLSEPPKEMVNIYDRIVVEPDNIVNMNSKYIAYLSVCEVGEYRDYFKEIKADWIIGKNEIWGSLIVDITIPEYQNLLFSLIDQFVKRGFRGVFLDTLDSYLIVIKNPEKINQYAESIASFIKVIRQRYPHIEILVNRGFEFIDESFKDIVNFFVVEDLYTSYDFESKKYLLKSEQEVLFLKNELKKIFSYGIPIVVIDYVDPSNKILQIKIAQKILKDGFIPFITTIDLDHIGFTICSSNFWWSFLKNGF